MSDLIFQTEESLLDKDPPPGNALKYLQGVKARWNQAKEIVLSQEFPPRLPPDEIEDEIPAGPSDALIET